MYNKILYILNPKSNESRALQQWNGAREHYPFLPETPILIGEVGDLASKIIIEKPDLVVAAGGDGTINSVFNAVADLPQKPHVAILPFGYGNALAYVVGVETLEKAMRVIKQPAGVVTMDLIKTSLPGFSYAAFYAGVGFDARIVHSRMHRRYIGFRSYILSAVRSLFEHPEQHLRITIDRSVTIEGTASSLAITNSPIVNRNYVVAEHAKLNDGYLDCILFSTKYAYLRNLRFKGFKHPLYGTQNKVYFKAHHVRIEGDPYVQVDGDPMVHGEAVEFEIAPQKITLLRNEISEIDTQRLGFIQ